MTNAAAVKDPLPIAVRAFLDDGSWSGGSSTRPKWRRLVPDIGPSDRTLIFDTETTTDAAQQLRFGCYQLRKGDRLEEAGIFYDPESLTKAEQALIVRYAAVSGRNVMTAAEFIEDIFYGVAYRLGAAVVGFNLPFDLSRLAIRHASARGKAMRGGFSLQLSPDRHNPPVQIKHLSRRAALIRFVAKRGQRTPRGMRRRRLRTPARRGYFIDVKTLAAALTARTFSLGSLGEFLGLPEGKPATDEHGGPLTEAYLGYAIQDVQVTWECYRILRERYTSHALAGTPVYRVLSEAGIGKAYLKEMGLKPWHEVQPDVPGKLIGAIMSTYYGGRSEVRLRRVVRQVAYCDFLSMYPTVCTLMGLWRFVIADGMTWHDATEEARGLLARVTLLDLQALDFWQRFPMLVQVASEDDLFPVRAKYGNETHYTIGLNRLSSKAPLWFTFADCLAAKVLTGKTPHVIGAVGFAPGAVQNGLKPIAIAGNPSYSIDAAHDDFYRRLIDLRSDVKREMRAAQGADREQKDTEQLALKILANATSYGIFVELNVDETPKPEDAICHGPNGNGFPVSLSQIETPGRYFHPLLATLITGAARLMLAIAEQLVLDAGLEWVFCDTDSLAIAKPEAMSDGGFQAKISAVRDWFVPLNPYAAKGSLLKLEDANFGVGRPADLEPLFAFAVSAKRYALFNLDTKGRPILRKASAHGLGHLIAPYQAADIRASEHVPAPVIDLAEIGVERWQHDFWYRIVSAALNGHPAQVGTDGFPGLDAPAVSRYAATTPSLLRWFRHYNRRKPYRQQVRPFGFLLAFQAKRSNGLESFDLGPASGAGGNRSTNGDKRRTKTLLDAPRAVAPFDRDPTRAARQCFDREIGNPVPTRELKSYGQALLRYHLHPEAKFHGGRYTDRGPTRRRHVEAVAVQLIGKEANRWEEQFHLGADPEAQSEYGMTPEDRERAMAAIQEAVAAHGMQTIARRAKVSRQHLHDILAGRKTPPNAMLMKLARAAHGLTGAQPRAEDVLPAARECCQELGRRRFARLAGVNDGHLGRILSGARRPSGASLAKLARALGHGSAQSAAARAAAPDHANAQAARDCQPHR